MAGAVNSSWQRKLASKLMNYKGNWLRENRGSLMTVAALIVTVTLQPAIAPPGGVWQNRTYPMNLSNNPNYTIPPNSQTDEDCTASYKFGCFAGTAILGNRVDAYNYNPFTLFIGYDVVSFMTSLAVLFMLTIGLPRENDKMTMWILTITVCISLFSLGLTFMFGLMCILHGDSMFGDDAGYALIVLILMGALFIVIFVSVNLVKWFVRKYHVVGDRVNHSGHANNA